MTERNTRIRASQIASILPDDLESTNSVSNEYTPRYDSSTGKFTWIPPIWKDVRNYASINAAITAIGSDNVTLLVPNNQTLTASLTVPSNITLQILNGGSITKASTYTLTINGPLIADYYTIFSGFSSGDVTFGSGVDQVFAAWWGFATSATAATNKTAILCAIASCSTTWTLGALGGEVILHRGVFNVSADIEITTNNITLSGIGNFLSYTGDENPPTTLVFATGTNGLKLGNTSNPSKYITVRNMKIKGEDLITDGIWISGQCSIHHVTVASCTNGFHFAKLCNQANLDNVASLYNSAYGVLIDSADNTVMQISNSEIRENDGHGIGILDGVGLSVYNTVIEANYGRGLYVYRAGSDNNIELHSFTKCWFEGNDRTVAAMSGGHPYAIEISAYNHYVSNPYGFHFIDCKFDQDIDAHIVNTCRFDGCYGGTIYVGSTATNVTTSNDTYGMDMVNAGDTSNWKGSLPTLPNGTIATTQSANDNSTKVATTAYADTGLNLKAPKASPQLTGNIDLDNDTTNTAFYIHQDGDLGTGKCGLWINSTVAQTTSGSMLLYLSQLANSTQLVADIDNNGTGTALQINQSGVLASNNYGLYLYSNAVQNTSPLAKITQDNASSNQDALSIQQDGSGNAINITAGKIKLPSGGAINEFSTDTTLGGNSDDAVPTEKAVKTYVDTALTTWTNYSTTSTINGFSSYTIKKIYYLDTGKIVFVMFDLQGTSNGTTIDFTLPFTVSSTINQCAITSIAEDNGTYLTTPGRINISTTNITCYKDMFTKAWTNSGEKRAMGQFFLIKA